MSVGSQIFLPRIVIVVVLPDNQRVRSGPFRPRLFHNLKLHIPREAGTYFRVDATIPLSFAPVLRPACCPASHSCHPLRTLPNLKVLNFSFAGSCPTVAGVAFSPDVALDTNDPCFGLQLLRWSRQLVRFYDRCLPPARLRRDVPPNPVCIFIRYFRIGAIPTVPNLSYGTVSRAPPNPRPRLVRYFCVLLLTASSVSRPMMF